MQPSEYNDGQTWIITAGERLARDLRARLAKERRRAGKTSWVQLPILGWRQFLRRIWQDQLPTQRIADATEEAIAYEQAIENDPRSGHLMAPQRAAELARKAAGLATDYRLDDRTAIGSTAEGKAFLRWHDDATDRLTRVGAIDIAHVARRLAEAESLHGLPVRIVHVGFEGATPRQRALLDHLAAIGVNIVAGRGECPPVAPALHRPATETAMREAAGEQIRGWLAPYADTPDQAPSIALVVPNYERDRIPLEDVLQRYIAPHTRHPGAGTEPRPWRFVVGRPLAEQEIVAHALRALAITLSGNPQEQITTFLLADRFIGNGAEATGRARADHDLRERGGTNVSLTSLRHYTRQHAPRLDRRLGALQRTLKRHNRQALPSIWARRFDRRLQLLGWPGEGPFDGSTRQALHQLRETLATLGRFDAICGRLDHHQAHDLLRRVLTRTLFLPPVDHQTPVEVVPLHEIDGHRYDHVIVVDLHADHLPAKPNPNPLLPPALQRAAGIRDATPEGCFEKGKEVVASLCRLAPDVRILAPGATDNGQPRMPSPLFEGWPDVEPLPTAAESVDAPVLETTIERIPPLNLPDGHAQRGGAAVITDQTAHPFYAFVQHRLAGDPLPEPEAGVTTKLRGIALHAALREFWREVGDSDRLQGLTGPALERQIANALEAGFADREVSMLAHDHPRLTHLEIQRGHRTLADWIEHERARELPFRVCQTEKGVTVTLGPLRLRLRIDRVDEVFTAAGKQTVLIDYKTGARIEPRGWSPEHLSEPQLPLYRPVAAAMLGASLPVRGIAFAHLTPGAPRLYGWQAFADALVPAAGGRRIDDWEQLCHAWDNALQSVADEFVAGYAGYHPDAARNNAFLKGHLGVLARTDPDIQSAA